MTTQQIAVADQGREAVLIRNEGCPGLAAPQAPAHPAPRQPCRRRRAAGGRVTARVLVIGG